LKNDALDLYPGSAPIPCETAAILSDAIDCFIQSVPSNFLILPQITNNSKLFAIHTLSVTVTSDDVACNVRK